MILKPPKLYLDTNHLIYIARMQREQKLPEGQSKEICKHLDECVRSYCGLIFNPTATMDWVGGKATTQSISKIAAVIDSANLKYIMPESDRLVYTYEVLEQFHKQEPSIDVPDLPPIPQIISDNCTIRSSLGILANRVSDYLEENQNEKIKKQGGLPIEIPVLSAGEWGKKIFDQRQKNPGDYQKRIDDFKAQLNYDIQNKDVYFSDRQRYQKDWIKRLLKIDRILKAFNPQINDGDIDSILDKIDASECPAVVLYWRVREKRMKQGKPAEDNDVDDYMSIPVVPYADLVLMEKELRAFILQADSNLESKVFAKAAEAVKALENLKCNWQ